MTAKRRGATALGLAVVGALLLSSCGTDYNPQGAAKLSPALQELPVDCGGDKILSAEGSSAQKNAMDIFNAKFGAKCPGHRMAYTKSGSGKGVAQFSAGITDLGGSDSPLNPKKGEPAEAAHRCHGNPAWNLPMVFSPIAVAYNLPGVSNLTLNGDVTARIFAGEVTRWNAPAIAALNPGVALPDLPIQPFYRSDESGTSDNFQKYLSVASHGSWKGRGKQFEAGPGAGQGREGSDGVANGVRGTVGGITYVEWSFAKNGGLGSARIDNGSGPVTLTPRTAGNAVKQAEVVGAGHDMTLDLKSIYGSNAPGVYPIVMTTYEIVCSRGYDPDTARAVKAFLTIAAHSSQDLLEQHGYAPLPPAFTRKLTESINAIG